MASHPIPASPKKAEVEIPLTYEEGWDLLWTLEDSMKGWFPNDGGPSEVLRKEREHWGE